MKRFLVTASCVVLLVIAGGSPALAGVRADTPTPTPSSTGAATSAAAVTPTTGEDWVAFIAILGAIVVAAGILWLVNQSNVLQKALATAALQAGTPVQTALDDAGGSPAQGSAGQGQDTALTEDDRAARAAPKIEITGPAQLTVNQQAYFSVPASVQDPVWTVSGLTAYTRAKTVPHTLALTPQDQVDATISVSDAAGVQTGSTVVKVAPAKVGAAAAGMPFVLRLAVLHWGLVLVGVVIGFGAVALGVTGHLDGSNFVALVAPLAALLGVTSAVSAGSGAAQPTGSANTTTQR